MIDSTWFPPLLLVVGLAAIVWRWPAVRGTTLVAPVVWAILALLFITGMAMVAPSSVSASATERSVSSAGYLAFIATFCPPMALFGAKRPQDRGWQFIVATLWFVLALPAFDRNLLAMRFDQPIELHLAQSIFIVILMLMIAANYVPTRFIPASVTFLLAQVSLFWGLTPIPVALAMCVGALWLACLPKPRGRQSTSTLDRLWLDFRDAYGAVWGLRVAQRINQAATICGWNVHLDWQGFAVTDGNALSAETEAAIREQFQTLLRRFVSPEWIADRLHEPVH